jgi:hypothetical protein
MVTNFELSAAECEAVAEVRMLLGDNLSDFILSGLGEAVISHRRSFTARSIQLDGEEIIYQLELVNDSELGLPMGRDPIVIATLLDLLWERQPLDSTIMFRQSDTLQRLEWNDNAESQGLIKGALERYAFTAYCLVDPALIKEEYCGGRYTSIGRLLTGYEMASPLPQKKMGQPRFAKSESAFTRAHFLPGLIHDIISEKKYFLGIEFQKLKSLSQLLE